MQTKNMISNIQRFCIHDGPGIRTTVFLKGCPLHCAWCANPETQSASPEFMFKSSGPTLCGTEMTTDEIMNVVLRDKTFYAASNGGLTISGGEPLMQSQLCKELFQRAKEAGISTCIETSLFAPSETVADLEPYIDHIYFDLKHSDAKKHKKYTGVDNTLIYKNMLWLLKMRPDAVVRIPVIPNFNDSSKDIASICQTLHTLGVTQVELMRYHNLASSKYHSLGRSYAYEQIPHYTDTQFLAIVHAYESHSISILQ